MNTIRGAIHSLKPCTIGIDVDDNVFPFIYDIIKWLKKEKGINMRISDFTSYHIDRVLGIDINKAEGLVLEYIASDEHEQTLPFPGSKSVLREAAELGYILPIITSRREDSRDATERFLIKNIGEGVFDGTHFSYNPYTNKGKNGTKAEICKKHKIPVILEDSVEHAQNLVNQGIRVIMLDWPWNRKFKHPLVTRVYSWR
ncbi:MAG: hypothetical protein AABX66_03500 [Nanoarchaeota archaeon]